MADSENKETVEEVKADEVKADEVKTDEVVTDETKTEETKTDEPKTVPYERVKELTETIKGLEEQITTIQQQQALARANPVQTQQQVQQFDIYKEVGLDPEDPEDIPNQGQLKQIINHAATVFDKRLAAIAFQQAHPDYADLVGTADEISTGKYAEPLAAAIKQNPALLNMIAQSGDPRIAAYEIAKLQKAKTKDEPIKKDEAKSAIEEAVENANRVKSSSNAKGGEALSEEGRIANMSPEDFVKLALSHGAII